jgi:hypothetical protein
MTPKPPSNGLSARANRCLSSAGIPAEKEAVLHALKTGALYPYFRPALYGKKTHQEVCRWAGLDESFVSPTIPKNTTPLAIDNGLSYRANRLLARGGIQAEKPTVLGALQTGALRNGICPVNHGKQTHAELCRWAGVDEHDLPGNLSVSNRKGTEVKKVLLLPEKNRTADGKKDLQINETGRESRKRPTLVVD